MFNYNTKEGWKTGMYINRFLFFWFILGGFTQDAGFFILAIVPSFIDLVICKTIYDFFEMMEQQENQNKNKKE